MKTAIRLLGLTLALWGLTWVGTAGSREWLAESVRGTVLEIVDGRWTEFEDRSIAESRAIRTLQSGRLELRSGGTTIKVGPNVTLELITRPDDIRTLVRHYAGTIAVEGGPLEKAPVELETEELRLVVTSGSAVSVAVTNDRAIVEVSSGSVEVTTDSGKTIAMTTGQELDSSAVEATGNGNAGAGGNGNGSASGGGNGNGNAGAGGNGNGNAGAGGNGNGNAGAGGTGNGNAGEGGNGNGNAGEGGNGNGNAGEGGNGNGNENENENENGNAGGNGNGNGNSADETNREDDD